MRTKFPVMRGSRWLFLVVFRKDDPEESGVWVNARDLV